MSDPLGTIRTTVGRGAIKVGEDSADRPGWLVWTTTWTVKLDLVTDEDVSAWADRSEERCGDSHVDSFSTDRPGCSRPRVHTVTDGYDVAAGHSMYPLPGDYLGYEV